MQALAARFPSPVESTMEIAVLIGAVALVIFLWVMIAMAMNQLAKLAAKKLKKGKQSEGPSVR